MNSELINFDIILGSVRKIKMIRQSRQTMLKINTFQNLTQYLVYFKKYINIATLKKEKLIIH